MNHILARTAWGEARGEGAIGMAAVLSVIMNRAKQPGWWGRTPVEVCLKPKQFSCWNPGDPNRHRIIEVDESDELFRKAIMLEAAALNGTLKDPTGGATHYCVAGLHPSWEKSLRQIARIGNHKFFR